MSSPPHETAKRVELDSLIMNLKKNLQTFSDKDVPPTSMCAAKRPASLAETSMVMENVMQPPPTNSGSKHNQCVCFFVNKAMFTTELFCFFFLFLLCIRPSFLYYSEKVVQNRREMIRTRFSVLYLCIWSLLLTMSVHLFSYVQKKMSIAYPYYS